MNSFRIAIIGGGISGLTAAYSLSRAKQSGDLPIEIHLFEAKGSCGGLIQTFFGRDFCFEKAVDSFMPDQNASELLKSLGLEQEIIEIPHSFSRVFFSQGGKFETLPLGPDFFSASNILKFVSMPSLDLSGKFRFLSEIAVSPQKKDADENLGDFIKRRFGRHALEAVFDPLVRGIFMTDPHEMSVAAALPFLREDERKYGSILKAMRAQRSRAREAAPVLRPFIYIKKGLEKIVHALQEKSEISLHLSSSVMKVEKGGSWRVFCGEENGVEFDAVCLAMNAFEASRICGDGLAKLNLKLQKIPYESIGTCGFIFKKEGFLSEEKIPGWIIPKNPEQRAYFSSLKVIGPGPDADQVRIRVFFSRTFQPHLWPEKGPENLACTLRVLRSMLKVRSDPDFMFSEYYPSALPQYPPGYLSFLEAVRETLKATPHFYWTGSFEHRFGIAPSLRGAHRAAQEILKGLKLL